MSPVNFKNNIAGIGNAGQGQSPRKAAQGGVSFDQALQAQIREQAGVKISAHAQKRLAERDVKLDDIEQARLGAAMDRVQRKGADKSLVLMDDLALVVSARNRVVITALDSASAKDGVFTGIDSAVIA